MTVSTDPLFRTPLATHAPRARWEAARDEATDPVEVLVRVAIGAHTLGEVFYAAYQVAVARLLPAGHGPGALLVAETCGSHPRSLRTTFGVDGLHGEKRFAVADVDTWWVLARTGEVGRDGRADLRLVPVSPRGEGVKSTPGRVGLLPDVGHHAVVFRGARPVAPLVERAWSTVVRPFRAWEDAAILLGVALAAAHDTRDERWLAVGAAVEPLLREGPEGDRATLVLAGAHALATDLCQRCPPTGPLADGWERDLRLLALGTGPREHRRAASGKRWSDAAGR